MTAIKPIKKLLIANRGEIACRIIRTAKRMGIKTVAVFSEIDAKSLHTQLADEAICIGPTSASSSYLNQKNILRAAAETQVDAIHPGYGFLSENAEFAEQCLQNGFIFVGPSPAVMRLMGDKRAAKKTMAKLGAPIIPGYQEQDQSLATLQAHIEKIGLPVLIKAAAGGGGKGMRLITELDDLADIITSAKREAKSSFGDDAILLEKYLPRARHIEVQIIGDTQGHAVHLFTRDCSVQRRHQKIIEEAPAPNLSEALQHKIANTAAEAAQKIQYSNAGTMEFLVDGEHYYFMEMNTRLQVEHPITEMITGIDLVEWQLRIAQGEPLPLTQNKIKQHGHAFEARICAENPFENYKPSSGKLHLLQYPPESDHVRIDTGVHEKDSIHIFYDSMIAKIITWGENRESALQLLASCLAQTHIVGVECNVALLTSICTNDDFRAANFNTRFLEEHLELIENPTEIHNIIWVAAALFYHSILKNSSQHYAHLSEDSHSPWFDRDHWRLGELNEIKFRFWVNDHSTIIALIPQENHCFKVLMNQKEFLITHLKIKNHQAQFTLENQPYHFELFHFGSELHIFDQGHHYRVYTENPKVHHDELIATDTHLTSPMPGTLVAVLVKPQQQVNKGDKLVVLEAMKMEHTILAPMKGVIKTIHFKSGDMVSEGSELLEFETS